MTSFQNRIWSTIVGFMFHVFCIDKLIFMQIYSEQDRSKMPLELGTALSIEREPVNDPEIRIQALEAIYLISLQVNLKIFLPTFIFLICFSLLHIRFGNKMCFKLMQVLYWHLALKHSENQSEFLRKLAENFHFCFLVY